MGTNAHDDLLADIHDRMHPDAFSGTTGTVEPVPALRPPGGSVLEPGAGDGRPAVPPTGRGVDVSGIGSSARMPADGPARTVLRHARPAETDAMARCAGPRLVERYAGRPKEPCGPGGRHRVSVHEAADAA